MSIQFFFSLIPFSCRCPRAVESLNMDTTFRQNDQAEPGEEEATRVRVDDSSADPSDRQRVLDEVGSISIFFIGPELPPSRVEPDLEETLSEFYKELQDLDPPEGAAETSGTLVSHSFAPSYIPLSLQPTEAPSSQLKPDEEQERKEQGREQKQSSWPHWYDNKPYHRGGPRSFLPLHSEREEMNPDRWQRRQSVNRLRPPPPRFHRPRLHRPTPPTAFPYHQNAPPPPLAPLPPAHMNHDWGSSVMTNHYDEEPGFLAFPRVPPPNFDSHVSVRPIFDSGRYFDQHQQGYDYDEAPSSSAGASWRPDENEGRYQWAAEPVQRDLHCPPADEDSSLVLILMRGLPGSGKSTLARYVVSAMALLRMLEESQILFSFTRFNPFILILAGNCCLPAQAALFWALMTTFLTLMATNMSKAVSERHMNGTRTEVFVLISYHFYMIINVFFLFFFFKGCLMWFPPGLQRSVDKIDYFDNIYSQCVVKLLLLFTKL